MSCCHIQPASDEDKHFLLLGEGHLWSVFERKAGGHCIVCSPQQKYTNMSIYKNSKILWNYAFEVKYQSTLTQTKQGV